MYTCPPDLPCLLYPIWIVIWKPWCPSVAPCVCPSHPASGHIPWLKCVHASVHVYISTWLPMSASPHLINYIKTWVPLCDSVSVCPSHPASGRTLWLKCVHASLHVYMSIWLPMSALPLLYSYMQTWVSLCGTVYLIQSTHSFFCMCTCIRTYINIHLTPQVSSTPLEWRSHSSKWRSHC